MTLFPSMASRFGTTFYSPWWEPESKKPSHRAYDLPLRSAPASSSSRSTCSASQFPPPRLPTNDIQKRGQASLKKYINTQPDGAKLWQEVSGRFGRADRSGGSGLLRGLHAGLSAKATKRWLNLPGSHHRGGTALPLPFLPRHPDDHHRDQTARTDHASRCAHLTVATVGQPRRTRAPHPDRFENPPLPPITTRPSVTASTSASASY